MFNLIIVLLILSLNIFAFSDNRNSYKVYATSSQTYFARVMADDVYLYKNAIGSEDFSNIYFELPRTYFVELLDDYNTDFYVYQKPQSPIMLQNRRGLMTEFL